eukprot:6314060-Pyramimonas_sp.AAC.1
MFQSAPTRKRRPFSRWDPIFLSIPRLDSHSPVPDFKYARAAVRGGHDGASTTALMILLGTMVPGPSVGHRNPTDFLTKMATPRLGCPVCPETEGEASIFQPNLETASHVSLNLSSNAPISWAKIVRAGVVVRRSRNVLQAL